MAFIQDQNQLALRRQALIDAAEKNIGGAIDKYADYRQKEIDKQAALDLMARKRAMELEDEQAKEEARRIFELDKQGKELAAKATQEDLNRKNELEKARIAAQGKGASGVTSSNNEYKERKELESYDKNAQKVAQDYADLVKVPLQSSIIPSALGGSKESYESKLSNISANLVGKFPGIRSDADFRNIIVPMLPKKGETKEEGAKKAENFKKFLLANRPASPILESKGEYGEPDYFKSFEQPVQPTQGLTREQKIEAIRKAQGL